MTPIYLDYNASTPLDPRVAAVMRAMGVEPRVGIGAVRLSLGRMTTRDEIDAALGRFAAVAGAGLSPATR